VNIFWIQSGCCGGESISLLNAEQPDLSAALELIGAHLLWHPTLSDKAGTAALTVIEDCLSGKTQIDVLVVEGAVYDNFEEGRPCASFAGRTTREVILSLAHKAFSVVAAGTCASFGGIAAAGKNPLRAVGLQFYREQPGGLLGPDFTAGNGLPVVNIPGCPAHPDWMVETFMKLSLHSLQRDDLDRFQRPRVFYEKLAHHACPRNEYYEFKASAELYSQQGCLFENLGCKGTQCESDCNERLWLGRTGSCTRGGFPCISCTSPKFPDGFVPFFETRKIGDIPTTLPLDVPKAWYVGMSGLAKLACPERLKTNAVSHIPLYGSQENKEDE